MSNYNNIKPYADFSHKAAEYGGPEQYVKLVAQKNFAAGIQAEKSAELGKGTVLFALGIAACIGGQYAYKKYIEYKQDKMNHALAEAEKANEECIEVLKNSLGEQNDDLDLKEEDLDNCRLEDE